MTNTEEKVCEYCLGDGYTIHDWSDPSGEHMQTELPCECQVLVSELDEDLTEEYDYTT